MSEEYYKYLLDDQYKDPSNLDARAFLHQRFSKNRRGLHRWIFDHLQNQVDGNILELGAGPAHLWRRNKDRIPSKWNVVVSDISAGMVAAARNELSSIPAQFCYSVIDAQSLPFPSGCFNTVIANHMIYHIPDIPGAIEEIHRIISSDGCLLASTNEEDHMQEVDELVHSIESSIIFGSCDLKGTHLIPFSMSNGGELLKGSFEMVEQLKFDDELIVTEVEPLIQYILSYPGNAREIFANENKKSELRSRIAEQINQDGAFCITKSAGLFIATKN